MKSGLNGISADRPFPVTCPVGDLCGSNLTFHIGQDNRTNIPKRDVDGADQSSDSTPKPLHCSLTFHDLCHAWMDGSQQK